MNENINILSIDFDKVIKSRYITASTNYQFAINHLFPLIDRLDIQRNIQDNKFYHRLEKDLVTGCIMPPITLAFVDENIVSLENKDALTTYLNENIELGFILDGIQRLNTLNRTYKKNSTKIDLSRVLFLNIVICSSMDNLLYRMITLNNGQKPMSARHQIEILTANLFEFEESDTPIITEREAKTKKIKVAFNKGDFMKGYLAFLANSTNIDNQKIIEEKLDELLADKILDSGITEDDIEFKDVVYLINYLSSNIHNYKWFKNPNNLIGFCVGIKTSFSDLKEITEEDFHEQTKKFEDVFSSFDISKITVGKVRKNLSNYFISNYTTLKDLDTFDLLDNLSQIID